MDIDINKSEKINELLDEMLENKSFDEKMIDKDDQELLSLAKELNNFFKLEKEVALKSEMKEVDKRLNNKFAEDGVGNGFFSRVKLGFLNTKTIYKFSGFALVFLILGSGAFGIAYNNDSIQNKLSSYSKGIVLTETDKSDLGIILNGKTSYGQDPANSSFSVKLAGMSVDETKDLNRYIKFTPHVDFETKMLQGGETFVINPTSNLAYGQKYKVRISKSIKMDSESKLNKNLEFSFDVRPEMKLVCVTPSDKATNVPLDSKITIEFNYICRDLSNMENLILFEPKIEGEFEREGTKIVYTPTELKPVTTYKVIVKKEIYNEFNETIPESSVTTFTTAAK